MIDKGIFLIKVFVCLIGVLASCYVTGAFLNCWLKLKDRLGRSLLFGFVFQISLFECVALPFMLRKGSFSAMITCYLAVFCFVLVLSFVMLLLLQKRGIYQSSLVCIREELQERRQKKWFGVTFFGAAFLVLVLGHIAGVTLHQITMGDDVYYVSLATYAIDHNSLETNTMFISSGILSLPDIRPNISAWEYYVACLSVVFHLHPAQMFHFVLPLFLIPFSYLSYYYVIKKLFDKKYHMAYMMWFVILNLFFSFSAKLNSYNMFNCPWMGKVVLYNILMPCFLAVCIDIMKAEKETLKYWICVVFLMIAGICTTVVGVYMIPIYYAAIGITYAVTIRSMKEFKKLIVPVLVTVIPAVIGLLLVLQTEAGQRILEYSKTEPKRWTAVFLNYWGIDAKPVLGVAGLVLFFVSCVVIFRKENRITKTVLCGLTIFCALTIVNPLFIGPVSSFLTGADLYWRMFILVPVVYVLPYLPAKLCVKAGTLHHYEIVIGFMLVVSVGGTLLGGGAFSDKKIFAPYETTYGIPEKCVQVTDYIMKKEKNSDHEPVVLYPPALRQGLRQYTTKLTTMMSRMYYQGDYETPYGTMREVCRGVFKKQYTEEQAYQVLKGLNVDYVVTRRYVKFRNPQYFTKCKRYGRFVIYHVN